jgi:hypothetical protein
MPAARTLLIGLKLAAILPPYALYYTVYTLVHGPSHPAWGVRTSVLCACCRLAMRSFTSPDLPLKKPSDMPAPTFPEKAWKASKLSKRFVGKGTRVVPTRAPAIAEDLLRGTARVGDIGSTDVPVFWVGLSSMEHLERPAKEGEKVLVYLGGAGTHVRTPSRDTKTIRNALCSQHYHLSRTHSQSIQACASLALCSVPRLFLHL